MPARAARYRRNHDTLLDGLHALGLLPYLDPAFQSHIITAFPFPAVPGFAFAPFYRGLCDQGFIIYPGKLTRVDTFRIGTIGRLFPADLEQLVHAVRLVLADLGWVPERRSADEP
jgi:2-aminoethylphosphonate-pyruvate transaminase